MSSNENQSQSSKAKSEKLEQKKISGAKNDKQSDLSSYRKINDIISHSLNFRTGDNNMIQYATKPDHIFQFYRERDAANGCTKPSLEPIIRQPRR